MHIIQEIKLEISDFIRSSKKATAFLWLFVAAFPLYLTLATNGIGFSGGNGLSLLLQEQTGAFFYGLVLVCLVYLAFLAITPKVPLATGLTGFLFIALALVDQCKFLILKEHFYPWDLLFAKNAGSFTEFLTTLTIPQSLWELSLSTVFYVLALYFMCPVLPVKWRKRAPFAPVLVASLYGMLAYEPIRKTTTAFFGLELESSLDQNTLYQQNGFLTAFALNCGSLELSVPANYSQSYMQYAFAPYLPDPQSGATFQNPDIVIVLSEAFWDPSTLKGVTFSPDPLANFHAIAQAHPSGKMVSPTFGGGTVRPEFEILSGMSTSALPPGNIPYQQYVTKDIFSFARHYKNLGYDALGVHTYQKNFYDRDKAYPFMGFDAFLGEYDLNAEHHWNSGPYIADQTMAEEIIYQLNQPHETGLFLMGITMENHSMYQEKYDPQDWSVDVSGDALSEQQIITLKNYATGVRHADAALKEVYDFVMHREKPTIVLWYGDHLPTLGDDFDPYITTGNIQSTTAQDWTEEEKYDMFSTPYVMFANYDTGRDYQGTASHVSPYALPALMADYVDAPETLQGNFLLDLYKASPVNSSYYNLYGPEEDASKAEELRKLHELMTYDMLLGENYLGQRKE